MKKVTLNAVKNLLVKNNASGKISMSYLFENGKKNYNIHFSNGAIITFENSITSDKVFRILKLELMFKQNFNLQTDENDGIIQASQLGQNAFACTIMCNNPKLNGVFN